MVIAACIIELELVDVRSLKEKRSLLKPVLKRLSQEFNVAVAEIAHHDQWHSGVIGLVTVGVDAAYLHGLLEKAVAWMALHRPDLPIAAYSIEFR